MSIVAFSCSFLLKDLCGCVQQLFCYSSHSTFLTYLCHSLTSYLVRSYCRYLVMATATDVSRASCSWHRQSLVLAHAHARDELQPLLHLIELNSLAESCPAHPWSTGRVHSLQWQSIFTPSRWIEDPALSPPVTSWRHTGYSRDETCSRGKDDASFCVSGVRRHVPPCGHVHIYISVVSRYNTRPVALAGPIFGHEINISA